MLQRLLGGRLPHLFTIILGANAWSCDDAGATTVLAKVKLGEVDRLAVCNDGSEAAYYLEANTSSREWLVYLAGGGWCHDHESCAAREDGTAFPHQSCNTSTLSSPCFMSNKDFPETCGKTGIFDRSGSPLQQASKVYVPYCTSDAYMGDGAFGPWQFRGARIVRAVLKDLRTRGLRPGSRLIFGGGSAGSRGAMVLLDEVTKMLPGIQVHGFLDSPYWIDIPSSAANFSGFQHQTRDVLTNFNAWSVVSQTCYAQYRSEEAWKCLFGQYRMAFVRTPYLLIASQFDSWQLSHLVHGYSGIQDQPAFTPTEVAYTEKFAAQTRSGLDELAKAVPSGSYVYSAACYNHHISEKGIFFTSATSSGFTESEALAAIWRGHGDAIDRCDGFNCSIGCGPGTTDRKSVV